MTLPVIYCLVSAALFAFAACRAGLGMAVATSVCTSAIIVGVGMILIAVIATPAIH